MLINIRCNHYDPDYHNLLSQEPKDEQIVCKNVRENKKGKDNYKKDDKIEHKLKHTKLDNSLDFDYKNNH